MVDTVPHIGGTTALVPTTIVAKFPVGTFLENIAVRKNGTILVSDMLGGEIFYLDPQAEHPQSTIRSIYNFNANFDENNHEVPGEYGAKRQVMAIVEDLDIEDTFYTFSGLTGRTGTWAVWRIDLRKFDSKNINGTVKVEKVFDIPQALWLNGGTMIPKTSTLLMADSILEQLFRWDISTGQVSVWLEDTRLGKTNVESPFPGVNGLKYFKDHVYATCSDRFTFLRAAVDHLDGKYVNGSLTVLATQVAGDDFAFDEEGNAYITTHPFNTVIRLPGIGLASAISSEERATVVGNMHLAETAGPTALAFGRTSSDDSSLYITTDGGLVMPVGEGPGEAVIVRADVGVRG